MNAEFRIQSTLITVRQIRMAKALLGVMNPQLQRDMGLHRNTLSRLERGNISTRTLRMLRSYFESKGIVFIEDTAGMIGVVYEPKPDEFVHAPLSS